MKDSYIFPNNEKKKYPITRINYSKFRVLEMKKKIPSIEYSMPDDGITTCTVLSEFVPN